MTETQWSRADRAAAALQAHVDEVNGAPGTSYGDEGSQEFDAAVMALMVDLKHLLWRTGDTDYALTDVAESAVGIWAAECEVLPVGGDEDVEDLPVSVRPTWLDGKGF